MNMNRSILYLILFLAMPSPLFSMEESKAPKIFVVSSCPKAAPSLTDSEKKYVEKLCSILPLESILDEGAGEKACKAIGQEIFEKYKSENGGNSQAGKVAVQKICNAVGFAPGDGSLRKQFIARAWKGIGDESWQWRP